MTAPHDQESLATESTAWTDRRYLPIAVVILIGLLLTLAAYHVVQKWEHGTIDSELQRRAHNHAVVLQTMIDQHVELLESLAGLFFASNQVERNEFHRFVEPILARHQEVQAYSWNPRIRLSERSAFESAARDAGIPNFRVTELDPSGQNIPVGERAEYVAVYYLKPLSDNELALGYDIASEHTRREALEEACDLNQAATTRWVQLIQGTENQYGILITRPVYAADAALDTVQQRRDALRGYVVGVFRVNEMIEEALRPADPAGLDFWVYQDTEPRFPTLSYFHPSRSRSGENNHPLFLTPDAPPDNFIRRTLHLPGKQWSVFYKPAPAFLAAHSQHAAKGVLLAGIVLTTLLGFYVSTILRESRRAAVLNNRLSDANDHLQREIVERREAEKALAKSEQVFRSLIENAPEAITILDVQRGHFTEVNQCAEQLFGMSRERLLKAGPADLSPACQPDGRPSDVAAREWLQRAIDGGTPVFEWTHQRADGTTIPCEMRLTRLPDTKNIAVRATITDIRERKKAEGLRERLGRILDNSANEIYVFDEETLHFTQVNAGACANLGYSAEELAEKTPVDIKPEFTEERFREAIAPLYQDEKTQVRFDTIHERKNGTRYPIEVTVYLSRQETPRVFVAIIRDISERLEAEQALQESESYNRMLFEESPIGLALCDMDGNLVDLNPAFASILGRTIEETKALSYWDITPTQYRDNEQARLEELEHNGRYGPYEKEYIHKDGHLVPVRLTGRSLEKSGRQYIWSSVEDISDYVQARQRIEHMAFHDALTDLPNRELLHDRLDHAISLAHRNRTLVGVMFLDVDRFKTINDSLGHSVGDGLLKQIADRLIRNVREADTVARFGGDEFVIIAEGVTEQRQLETLAAGIIDRMRVPFQVGDRELFVTMSLGIALGAGQMASAEALIAQADIAMYKAKESGRNNYQVHSPDMGERVSARAALERDLRGAPERGELLFHVQPILFTDTLQPIGMEALMRWQHPQRGLVSPVEFIPVMEESGLITPASLWILESSCRYLADLQARTGQTLSISVNFSASCFYIAGITDLVRKTLAESGLQPDRLIIEITESTLFQDPKRVHPILEDIKSLGVRIALDDFGTGQSSLSHLRNFPIDVVKIDREFIRDVPGDKNDCELVSAIIAMAHSLKKCVIAEGVETKAQLTFLQERGCDRVQGYLLSPPIPVEEMSHYLVKVNTATPTSASLS